jgi:hypothetical protein
VRSIVRHCQGVIHALTPNSGNRRVLKNAWQPWKRLQGPPVIPVPQGTLFGVQIDDYGGFNRAYWNPSFGDIYDGAYHKMKFLLKLNPPNPGGTILADTDALRANTATSTIMWWDNNGTLGKMYLRQNDIGAPVEMTVANMADAIDAAASFIVRPEGVNLIVVGIIP